MRTALVQAPRHALNAVAYIHRFGSSRNAHLHFHCVVIDGVFEPAPVDGVVFRAATGLDANTIATVQAGVRRRLLRVFVRRGLLPRADAPAMAQWEHGGGFSVDGSARLFDVFLDTHGIAPAEDFQTMLWHRLCDSDVLSD